MVVGTDRRMDSESRARIDEISDSVSETNRTMNEHAGKLPGWRRELLEWQEGVEVRIRRVFGIVAVLVLLLVGGGVVVTIAGRSLAARAAEQTARQADAAERQAEAAQQLARAIQLQRVDSLVLTCRQTTRRNQRARRKLRSAPAAAQVVAIPLIGALYPLRSDKQCDADARLRVPLPVLLPSQPQDMGRLLFPPTVTPQPDR